MQGGERLLALDPAGRLVGEAMKQHRWVVHVAQVHFAQHLLRDAAVHGNREGRGRVVVERDLFPDRVAQPVSEHQQQRVGRVVVGTDQLDVDGVRLVEQEQDVVRRDDRTAARPAVHRRIDALVVKCDSREGDRVAIEQQARRAGVDADVTQAESLVQLIRSPLLPEHLDLEDIQRWGLRRPERGIGERKAGVHLARPIAAELAGIEPLRRDRHRAIRDQLRRIGVGEVGRGHCRRQDVEADGNGRGVSPTLMQRHGNIGAVEMRNDVGADHVNGCGRLDPDRLGETTIIPPIGQTPGNDVLPRAPGWVVDPDGDRVDLVGHQRVSGVEGKWGRAALVVTEPVAVQPNVGDVIGRAEFQRDGLVLPISRNIEVLAIPGSVG